MHMLDYHDGVSMCRNAKSDAAAADVLDCIVEWSSIYGPPSKILSDNDGPFGGEEFSRYCESNGIRNLGTLAYEPRSAGKVEKGNHIMKEAMKLTWLGMPDAVPRNLAMVCSYTKNISVADSGLSPWARLFGRMPKEMSDLMDMDPPSS